MEQRRERLVEELRMAERAQELLAGLEWHLKNGDRADLENHLRQLDRLAGSLPEGHIVRLVIESALGPSEVGNVSRARSAKEGEISTLQGALRYKAT